MSLAETALLVLGVCAVVAFLASLLWRSMGRRRELRVAREKLGSPNLATRDAGLNLALGAGLHASAPMLLQAVSDSPDEKFLAHVASLVNQRQWEPITSSQMDVLRTWAAEFATSVQDDVPRQRVLVTGAGGPAGVNLIKTLAAGGHFTIGVDPDPLAVGLYLSDEGETGLVADDSGNAQRILEVGIRHGATMLISTVSEEMSGLSAISSSLDAAGISHWLPTPDAVDSCIDKWRFAQVLLASGVKHPASSVGLDGSEVARSVPAPWIVKPRFGRGSRGVVSVDGLEELVSVLAHADSPITQIGSRACSNKLRHPPPNCMARIETGWRARCFALHPREAIAAE